MGLLNALRQLIFDLANGVGWRRSQRPRMQLGYVIPANLEMHDAMRKLQLRIAREHGSRVRIEGIPHITLKEAFEITELEPFERHFDTLVSQVAPFDVHVRNVGFFDEGIVFLDVVETASLVALRKRIVGELGTHFGVAPKPLEGERYRFHATVATGLAPSSLRRARVELRDEKVDFRFQCDTIGLLLHTGREWISYKNARLGRRDRPDQHKGIGSET